jgi:hypothetical protein
MKLTNGDPRWLVVRPTDQDNAIVQVGGGEGCKMIMRFQ